MAYDREYFANREEEFGKEGKELLPTPRLRRLSLQHEKNAAQVEQSASNRPGIGAEN